MSAAPLDPVYLIGGTDRPKVELAIRRLRARVRGEDGSVEEFTARRSDDDGEGMSGEEAAGACNALGLFGGTRLLVVQQAEVWGDDKKAVADVDALAALSARARARRRARAADDGRGARRAAAGARRGRPEACSRTTCPGREGQREWLRKQAARAGADLDGSALTRLLELAGDDMQALASEVEKLGLWSRGETITAERVDELCVLTRGHAALGSHRCARRPAPGRRAARARPPARRPRRRRAALAAVDRAPPAPARGRAARRRAGRRAQGHRARARAAQRVRGPQARRGSRRAGRPSSSRRRSSASRRSSARRAAKACCATASRSSARSPRRSGRAAEPADAPRAVRGRRGARAT